MKDNRELFYGFSKPYANGKALSVVTKRNLVYGKLDKRGTWVKKMFAHIIPEAEIPAGTKLVLRTGIIGLDSIFVYAHGFGWIELSDLNLSEVFSFKRCNIEDLFTINYTSLTATDKISAYLETYSEIIDQIMSSINLSESDKLIMEYINCENLENMSEVAVNELITQNHKNEYAETLLLKLVMPVLNQEMA